VKTLGTDSCQHRFEIAQLQKVCNFIPVLTGRAAAAPAAVREVECRCANQQRCRFQTRKPKAMEAIYQAMSEGDHRSVI
jgi:hypothetical protein